MEYCDGGDLRQVCRVRGGGDGRREKEKEEVEEKEGGRREGGRREGGRREEEEGGRREVGRSERREEEQGVGRWRRREEESVKRGREMKGVRTPLSFTRRCNTNLGILDSRVPLSWWCGGGREGGRREGGKKEEMDRRGRKGVYCLPSILPTVFSSRHRME